MSDRVRAHCTFSGLVQGVFFRANTRTFALQQGVSGWVKNLPDGQVEAVFEGDEDRVRELIRKCRDEQPHASVTDITVSWESYSGEYSDFTVRY